MVSYITTDKEIAMTETTQAVFERYEVRKTKGERKAFRDYAREIATREGYDCHEEKGSLGAVNLVVGDPTTARVTYTAHYDTCARMPFPNFITPTNIWIYLLYQLLIVAAVFLPAWILEAGAEHLTLALGGSELWGFLIGRLVFTALIVADLWLLMAGPANKHTANDNTSGVTTLLDLMVAMPADLRENVAFIFFDLEEAGTIGSMSYAGRHKQAMKDRPVVNFDCVSDGRDILFAVNKKASHLVPAMEVSFPSTDEFEVTILTKGYFYPSDQGHFPHGIGVAALKKTRRGLLYMDRIHTKQDTVYDEQNIAFLVAGSVRLAERLTAETD